MEKLDVPVFTNTSALVRHSEFSDPDLELLSARPDASVVRERLFQMSQADCDKQVEIIKQAIRDRFAESSDLADGIAALGRAGAELFPKGTTPPQH
jgi:hypothetical protein